MQLPVSDLLSLPEAVRFVGEATRENENRIRATLREAGLAGKITATGCLHSSSCQDLERYFAHQALNDCAAVPQQAWGTTISWLESRIGRYDLVRLNRTDIEEWLVGPHRNEHPRAEDSSPHEPRARPQPKRGKARRLLQEMFPDGIPPKEKLPDHKLIGKCKGQEWASISDDTIGRAAKELREATPRK